MENIEFNVQSLKAQLEVQSFVLGYLLGVLRDQSAAADRGVSDAFARMRAAACELPDVAAAMLLALEQIEQVSLQYELLESPAA